MPELSYADLDHVYIDDDVWDSKLARRVRTLMAADKMSRVKVEPFLQDQGELSARQFDRSKRQVYITNFKGQFFKRCPGAKPGLTCCNYFVLNLGLQCNMNCSYCYLQSFINSPTMKIYANIESALAELRELGRGLENQSLRIGTGEVIDSLSLDPLTLYSHELIEFFREFPNWRLEFKTKSSYVDQFLDVSHAKNVIVSFSINPQNIIAQEEHGTASLSDRLKAAEKCRAKGFALAFHIDPMIWHPKWKTSYAELIENITDRFQPRELPYLSAGALRFQPEQRHIMRERFGLNSFVTNAEMYPSTDGKLRYDQSLREEMFDFIFQKFRTHSKEWNIFLCMETPETWLGSVKAMPKSVSGLSGLFDHQVARAVRQKTESLSKLSLNTDS